MESTQKQMNTVTDISETLLISMYVQVVGTKSKKIL